MHDGDSRSPNGPGFLPLQAHGDAFRSDAAGGPSGIAGRPSVLASRRTGWDDWGGPLDDMTTRGELSGFMVWFGNGDAGAAQRPIPTWREVMPCITVDKVHTPSGGPAGEIPPDTPRDPIGGGRDPPPENDPNGPPDLGGGSRPPGSGDLPPQPIHGTAKAATVGGSDDLDVVGDAPPAPGAFRYGNAWVIPGGPDDSPGDGWIYSPLYGGWYIVMGSVPAKPGLLPPAPPPPSAEKLGPDTIVQPVRAFGFKADGSPRPGCTLDPHAGMESVLVDTDLNSPRFFWPAFAFGTFGITVITQNEDTQVRDFYPCDPRMVAVHKSPKNTDCGSLVYDLRSDGTYDNSRGATLQTAFRVLKGITGGLSLGGGPLGSSGTGAASPAFNSLALNIGRTGAGEGLGGFFCDGQFVSGTTRVGRWSVRDGGFVDVGQFRDIHQIGNTADGEPINPGHIATSAFFTDGGAHDGPIWFEVGDVTPTDNNFLVKVHWYFDKVQPYAWPRDKHGASNQGAWKLFASTLFVVSTPSGPPRPPVLTPPSIGPPVRTPGDPGFSVGSPGNPFTNVGPDAIAINGESSLTGPVSALLGVVHRYSSLNPTRRHYGRSTAEMAMTSRLFHPISYQEGEPDLRYQEGWGDPKALKRHEFTAPVTGRRSAYGQQNGNGFVYTAAPGQSRFAGGSGNGGEVLLPPEVDLSDILDGFAPPGLTVSRVYDVAGPGTRFGSGIPDLATGGLKSGFSWGHQTGAASVDLTFYSHNPSAVATEVLRLSAANATLAEGYNLRFGTITGSQLGTAPTQKLAFHGATPIVQNTGWSTSGLGTLKVLSAASTLSDVLDYLATQQAALIAKGVVGA